MRFHRLALSTIAFLALRSHTNNNGVALAEETEADTSTTTTPPPAAATKNYTAPENSETFTFQAEVNRMLDIVINSLYQNKDVFLRELISNASDALDKIRFLSIEKPELLKEKAELEVRVSYDPDAHTVTVTDSGIGMTHDDLVSNLGTVARSGTTKFLEALKEGADIGTIGMFGVGFYSSFLVADRVTVASKHPDDPVQHIWESANGEDSFHLYDDPRGNTLGRGTEITLYLKEDAFDYATDHKLEEIASYYSEFISHPIHLKSIKTEWVEAEEETETKEESDEEKDDLEVGDEEESTEEDEAKEPEMKEVTTEEWKHINTKKPIWTREKSEITDEEYQEFFKVIGKQTWFDADYWTHFNAEGNINFKSIIYVPSEVPQHLQTGRYDEAKKGVVKLYVRKVLISDEFPLLPTYLSWVKGVVDSDDLPLNVNRETLQESKVIKIIGKKLTRKALEMLKIMSREPHPTRKKVKTDEDDDVKSKTDEVELDADGNIVSKPESEEKDDDEEEDEMEDDPDKDHPYISFYKKFSPSLKLGIIRDDANRMRLARLLRFKTSKFDGDKDYSSFNDYVDRMPEWQNDIYYISGLSLEEVSGSHFMKKFRNKGVEVLYFIDPADEHMIQSLREFEGKKFVAITREGIKFPNEDEDLEKRRNKVYTDKFRPLTDYLKQKLGVMKVLVSSRLEDAPCMVSSSEYGQTATMERISQASVFVNNEQDPRNVGMLQSMRVLEINPRHPIIVKLLESVTPPVDFMDEEEDGQPKEWEPERDTLDLAKTMFDMALINSGFRILNTKAHTKRLTRVLKNAMGLESLAPEDEIELPEEEDDDEDDQEDGGMPDFDMDSMDFGNMESLEMEM